MYDVLPQSEESARIIMQQRQDHLEKGHTLPTHDDLSYVTPFQLRYRESNPASQVTVEICGETVSLNVSPSSRCSIIGSTFVIEHGYDLPDHHYTRRGDVDLYTDSGEHKLKLDGQIWLPIHLDKEIWVTATFLVVNDSAVDVGRFNMSTIEPVIAEDNMGIIHLIKRHFSGEK